MTKLKVHPVADLFPMLADDELKELAEDIKARGLLQPIVLDAEGRVLDGRNRLAACELAGIEPTFATFDGDDPDGYALSVNIARRHLTKGQQAMVVARALLVSNNSQESAANSAGLKQSRIAYAVTVRDHAPDLMEAVVSGAMGLDKAYEVARQRKTEADSVEAQLARLRGEDSDLADRVSYGDMNQDRIGLRKDLVTKAFIDHSRAFDAEITHWNQTLKLLDPSETIAEAMSRDST